MIPMDSMENPWISHGKSHENGAAEALHSSGPCARPWRARRCQRNHGPKPPSLAGALALAEGWIWENPNLYMIDILISIHVHVIPCV